MRRLPYRKVRSDEEFLQGIQKKINILDYALKEEERVQKLTKMRFVAHCRLISLLGIISIICWLVLPEYYDTTGVAYLWSILILTIAAFYEYFLEARRN